MSNRKKFGHFIRRYALLLAGLTLLLGYQAVIANDACEITSFETQQTMGRTSWFDNFFPKGLRRFIQTASGRNPLVNTVGAKKIPTMNFLRIAFTYWQNPHKALHAIHDQYGDYAYFQLPTGRVLLFARNKALLEEVTRDTSMPDSKFEKDPLQTSASEKVLGANNIFTNKGASWQSLREVLAPFFKPKKLREDRVPEIIASTFKEHFSDFSSRNESFTSFINQTIFDIVLKGIFKMNVDRHEVQQSIAPAFERVMNWIVFETALNPTNVHALKLPPVTTEMRQTRSAYARIEELADQIISTSMQNRDVEKNLIQTLVESGMSREDVRKNVMTIVAASFETTSSYISWATYEIARNPEIQNQIREELHRIGPAVLTNPDLAPSSLKHLMDETLRFYTPFYTFARRTKENTRIKVDSGTIDLPQDSTIIFDLNYINRQEAVFGVAKTGFPADVFAPLRYHPDNLAKHGTSRKEVDHNGFGKGRRVCLGIVFAQMETTLFLTQMLYHYRIQLPADFVAGEKSGIAIKPEKDLPIKFVKIY